MSGYTEQHRRVIRALLDEINAAADQPPVTNQFDLSYKGPPWEPADPIAFERATIIGPILQRELDNLDELDALMPYVTPVEAAAQTGTAASGWRNRAAAGKIPGAIKKGKQWLIPVAALRMDEGG